MARSHNIVGCEAVHDPDRRLAHFCHVHGAMRWGGPRRRRAPFVLTLLLAAALFALSGFGLVALVQRAVQPF